MHHYFFRLSLPFSCCLLQSLEEIMMETRTPLEWHFKQLDHSMGLSFRNNFNFALVGHLLKGFRHTSPTTVSRTIRVLNQLLVITVKPLNRDKFEVTPQTVPYLAALVSVSEEVRSRCHLKHRVSQYVMTDSPSSDSINAAEPETPNTSIGPSASAHSMSSPSIQTPANAQPSITPVTRRQKSWDILDKSAISVARNNTHLMQNQATLVRNTTDENEARILYEYLAEASVVFPRVFPVIHSLLDAKINSVLSLSQDQAILNAVQSIIQNMIACEDSSQQQLSFLQSIGFGGLWRFAGVFSKTTQPSDNAELFVKVCKLMVETCLPSGEPDLFNSSSHYYNNNNNNNNITNLNNNINNNNNYNNTTSSSSSNNGSSLAIVSNLNLSSSMSNLSVGSLHSPTEKDSTLDGFVFSGSCSLNNGSRMRHVSANNVSSKVTRSGSLKRMDSVGKRHASFQHD
ncbi:neurofibromin isoform X4 [Octopus sinensis]|uniref:Neurofibromin isoform X4 n=1 Tax=Octopus sinensis TaxID=2607531 RepID=A0A6P7TUF9_9MOLL|nr:neurofibromin isoform X4 [Octopus sinensis]